MSGPPELPLLIAVSVWISVMVLSLMVTLRSSAEMMPQVTVFWNWSPSGLPIATTISPTSQLLLSPNSAAVRLSASIFSTAISASLSYATMRAS